MKVGTSAGVAGPPWARRRTPASRPLGGITLRAPGGSRPSWKRRICSCSVSGTRQPTQSLNAEREPYHPISCTLGALSVASQSRGWPDARCAGGRELGGRRLSHAMSLSASFQSSPDCHSDVDQDGAAQAGFADRLPPGTGQVGDSEKVTVRQRACSCGEGTQSTKGWPRSRRPVIRSSTSSPVCRAPSDGRLGRMINLSGICPRDVHHDLLSHLWSRHR